MFSLGSLRLTTRLKRKLNVVVPLIIKYRIATYPRVPKKIVLPTTVNVVSSTSGKKAPFGGNTINSHYYSVVHVHIFTRTKPT